MAVSTIWWLLAGALIAAELVSGTFYLLMVAVGFVAAALSAHAGASLAIQLSVAALVSTCLVVVWWRYKKEDVTQPKATANHDLNMDIGEIVDVQQWNENGSSQVKYRGANWQVSLHSGQPLSPGKHKIIEVVGSRLIVKKI